MDYLRGIAILLCCFGVFITVSNGQNVADESPRPREANDGNRYTFRYGLSDERYNDDIPRRKPFHDIFAVKSLSGETERVHYAVDDHGIRTNIHSNAVKFGPKISTGAVSFGSRFTGWPSDNFDSMFLNVPQVNLQNPQSESNNEREMPVPSQELPPAFIPLGNAQPSTPLQQINLISDANVAFQNRKEQVPTSVITESVQPFYPTDLGYESQRISKPFLPNPMYPSDNLPLEGPITVNEERISDLQNPVPFKTESEFISKEPRSLTSLPEFVPQLSNLNYIQNQYANNQNLKWYQSLPQVPPANHPMYSAPFYPIVNKYESQRNAKPSPIGPTLEEALQNVPNPIDVTNLNVQAAALPNSKESAVVRGTDSIKSFPNMNEHVGSQKTSNSPIVIPESQNQKTNINIQQYVGAAKLARPLGELPGNIVSQQQKEDTNLNANKYMEYQKTSSLPFSNKDLSTIFESQKERINSDINQYIGSQKPSDAPEQLPSADYFEPQKQLINTNKYDGPDKISNLPVVPIDSIFVPEPKSLDPLSNTDQFAGSQKSTYQTFKQDRFPDQIKRNKLIINKGIPPSFPKNILSSAKQPTGLIPTSNKEPTVVNSKLSSPFRKNAQFLFSKSLVSSPMSTIFDTSNENGQYYHYVMNVGKKSENTAPMRTIISAVNLFKLLNDTGFRKLNDNKKITGNIINLNDSKTLSGSENPNLILQKLDRNTNKNFGSSLKTDLDASGDVIDATELFQDLPEINILDKAHEEKGDNQVLDKVVDEIINTEEPHPSTEIINQDSHLLITTKQTTESTTSSFLEDLFEYVESPKELPTENTVMESMKAFSGGENADHNTELASLFITLPENSLSSLFYDDERESNQMGLLKEKPSDEPLFFDNDTTSSELNSEIKTTTESRDSKELTPTTAVSFEISTVAKNPVTATETSSIVSTSSEASTESFSSESNKDSEDAMLSTTTTTKLIPSTITPTASPDVSTLFKDFNEKSESNTEDATSTVPSSSILVDVVNSGTTINQEITDLTDVPISSTEQPKPMLELVIQNTEMSDFMSRINNMPIMIRVLNPLTTTTEAPDVGREISTTEESPNLNFSTILSTSRNETADVSSTEATTLTSSTTDSKEIKGSDVSEEKTSASTVSALPTIQSNTNAEAVETLISEPNFEDTVILTSLKPQNPESISSDITNTETETVSNTAVSLTTPIPKTRETTVFMESQPPEALQYTLIRPGNPEILDSSLLGTAEFESFSDYDNKLASAVQNYNIDGPVQVHGYGNSGFVATGEPYTAMPLTNAEDHLIPMFIDSDQVHASEESQKIANFKSMNRVNNQGPKQSSARPVNFHAPSQPIIIKNSTVIQYQDISNYKGFHRHPTAQYVDFVPFKDIDYDSHVPIGNEDKFPSDAIFVLDDYDVLSPNPDGQNNEYVFIGNNGNFDSNILPENVLSHNDFDAQPVYILDSNTPNFGTRFQQEAPKGESYQEKITDGQQSAPLNFENFRFQRSFESKPDFQKEPWFPSQ